jgi:hypothetical protein
MAFYPPHDEPITEAIPETELEALLARLDKPKAAPKPKVKPKPKAEVVKPKVKPPAKAEEPARITAEIRSMPTPEELREEAIRILEHGDPVAFMLETFNETHKGDKEYAEVQIVSFGGLAAINSQGIYPTWTGPSGKGKSDGVGALVRQLPPKYVISSSITPKSLFYRAKDGSLLPGTVVFLDDLPIEADSDMESTLKRAHTDFQVGADHETIINGKWTATKLPPRLMFIRTAVDDKSDIQLKNRQSLAKVDESTEIDREVEQSVYKMFETGGTSKDVTKGVLICRDMWDIIKSHVFRVDSPNASQIIRLSDSRNRRNPAYFADLVIGYACINFMQRDQDKPDEHGVITLHASYEDHVKAAVLFNAQKDYLGSKLDPEQLSTVRFIRAAGSRGVTMPEIVDRLIEHNPTGGWNTSKVYRYMKGRRDRNEPGLLDTVGGLEEFEEQPEYSAEGGYNSKGRYGKRYRMNQEVEVGITVEILPEPTAIGLSVAGGKCTA